MEIYDNYELWSEYTFRTEQELSVDEITYWSSFHRWPLVVAVYLSMGQIPYHKPPSRILKDVGKCPTDPDKVNQLEDFKNRLTLAKLAAESGELVIEKIPDTRSMGHPHVERLVPVGNFIKWARENYKTIYDPLFDNAMSIYKNPEHAAYGRRKGTPADAVKELITAKAIEELEAGCQCRSAELVRYMMKLKNRNGTPVFTLPSIIEDRYKDHFCGAVIAAFKAKDIPLRNNTKSDVSRGKKLCKRPGHNH